MTATVTTPAAGPTAAAPSAPRRDLARRLLGFGSLPLLSAVAPLAILPVIARTGGADAWVAVATGQAVGVVASTVIGFGWSVTGPPRVARADDAARLAILRDAVRTRAAVAAPVLALAVVAAALLSPGPARTLAVLMACASAVAGFSVAWFCVGAGTPGLIARYEALPRVGGIAVSAALLLATGALALYPVLLLVSTVAGSALLYRRLGAELRSGGAVPQVAERLDAVPVRTLLRAQATGAAIELSGAAYTAAPVLLAGQLLLADVPGYVSGDRLYRLALYAVVVVGNAFQGWLPGAGPAAEPGRRRVALAAHVAVGVVGGAAFALLAPWASAVLFGEALRVPATVAVALGVAFLAVSVSTTVIRHRLLPGRGPGVVLGVTALGAVVGIAAVAVLGSTWGALGVAAGVAGGETFVVVALLVRSRLAGRAPRAAHRRAEGSRS